MIAIYKRELSSYFNSMIGYVFIAALVCFTGIYFMAYNLYSGFPDFSYALMSLMNILMFTVPILTMRSMAEDRRGRTDQLLLTAPVPLWAVVLGKYLAMVTVLFVPVFLAAFCPLIIAANGEAHLVSDYASLASLISLKLYLRTPGANGGKYLALFTAANVAGLVLLGICAAVFAHF